MKKRVAYIGISYPLLYDYRHQAKKCANDLSDSPNPIIESPLGLMILFDELLFLCRSVCPNNMRNLPYVKFVDELYPDLYFNGGLENVRAMENTISLDTSHLSFDKRVRSMHIEDWGGLDVHTHGLRLGTIRVAATSTEYNLLFDMYIFKALQQIYSENIELVANSVFNIDPFTGGAQAEFVDKIIVPGIPNYIGIDGPYHNCMEELRDSKYLKDFRRWIIDKHSNLQRTEIQELCDSVTRNIEEIQAKVFRRYLDENSGFSFFRSTGSTLIKTALGTLYSPISIADALGGSIVRGKKVLDAKSVRWQGFVMDSRNIIKTMR